MPRKPTAVQPAAAREPAEARPCLHLADGLDLPLEAVTETFAILAKRGSGKTYTAAVLVEEMLKAGQTVVVADPVGVWWGLRSSADGLGPGLPIAILGGDHADAPLVPEAGAAVADLAADERLSLVLDLSHFTPPEQTRFMIGFAERLYRRNRLPLHLVLDEADQFVPQTPEAGQQPLLWAMNRIVRLGRARGLGVTLISQRPAVLAKNVLTQTEVLITLRLTSSQDRKAVEAWVSAHDAPERRLEMLASLASLPIGTAWLWSPGWLDLLQRVQIRRRDTFDSSATPKIGQSRPEPATLAAMDLDRLRARLADLAVEPPAAPGDSVHTVTVTQRVEVPVLDPAQAASLRETASALLSHADALRADLETLTATARAILTRLDQVPVTPAPPVPAAPKPSPPAPPKALAHDIAIAPTATGGDKMPLAERKILTALVRHPGGLAKTQLAVLTGYAVAGGGFANALGALRSKGWLAGRDLLTPTDDGRTALSDEEPLPAPGPALIKQWAAHLPKAERLLLLALAGVYPAMQTKDQIAAVTGYAPAGGGFANALGRLRSLALIEGRADLRAAAILCTPP